jgi:hypothetical protein
MPALLLAYSLMTDSCCPVLCEPALSLEGDGCSEVMQVEAGHSHWRIACAQQMAGATSVGDNWFVTLALSVVINKDKDSLC